MVWNFIFLSSEHTPVSTYILIRAEMHIGSQEPQLRYVAGPTFEIISDLVPTCIRIRPWNLERNNFIIIIVSIIGDIFLS